MGIINVDENFWSSIISKQLHAKLSRQLTKINADKKILTNEIKQNWSRNLQLNIFQTY